MGSEGEGKDGASTSSCLFGMTLLINAVKIWNEPHRCATLGRRDLRSEFRAPLQLSSFQKQKKMKLRAKSVS
jgi:hypothetical protein